MSFAIFDLDQTLLPYDTQAMFCGSVLRRNGWRRAYLAMFGPAALLRVVRLLSTRQLKRAYWSCLWRLPKAELEGIVSDFVERDVVPNLYPEVLAEVDRHREAGRTLILNTASPEFYANAIGRRLGFHHTIGTRVQLANVAPLLPPVEGPNNKYDAKLTAMRHLMPTELSLPLPGAFAYSDSRADLPLLRFVENAVTVNPDRWLEQVAVEEGWRVMRLPRPNPSRFSFNRDCALQALGFWRKSGKPWELPEAPQET